MNAHTAQTLEVSLEKNLKRKNYDILVLQRHADMKQQAKFTNCEKSHKFQLSETYPEKVSGSFIGSQST